MHVSVQLIDKKSALCALCVLTLAASATASTAMSAGHMRLEGTIVVASSADFRTIFLIRPSTGAIRRVRAPDAMVSLRADISSDGKRIAISGSKGIWVFSRNGLRARRLPTYPTTSAFLPDWVTWSPSRRHFVYTIREALFTSSITGQGPSRILRNGAYAPDWSPTGRLIVFVRHPSSLTGAGRIQSIRPNGHGLRSIVRGGHPDISPDGALLAFARRDGIHVISTAGGRTTRVVRDGERPEWSPDGEHIAFTRPVACGDAGCTSRIFIVPVTGGPAHPIGPPIFDIGPLSWSQ